MKSSLTLTLAILFALPFAFSQSASDNWVFHNSPNDGWFGAIAESPDGRIFAGGGLPNSFFRVYDGNTWTNYTQAGTGVNFYFFGRDLAVDNNNVLWISPGNQGGITSWDGTTLTNYSTANSGINSNSVFGLAVDHDNTVWLTSMQSFDGTDWTSFSTNFCNFGGRRSVFVADDNDIWISGVYSVGIETGIITQPCVYRISNGTSSSFHVNNGDNLPELSGGQHLIAELADGTVLIAGKTTTGLVINKFDGSGWVHYATYNGSDVGDAFWGICVDHSDNIFIAGRKNATTSQIVKLCNGEWTVYDLPEADGFPNAIFDIFVDSQSRLWIAGDKALCSLEYIASNCLTTDIQDNIQSPVCEKMWYDQGYLHLEDCPSLISGAQIKVYDTSGRLVVQQSVSESSVYLGRLNKGIYFVQLYAADLPVQFSKLYVN